MRRFDDDRPEEETWPDGMKRLEFRGRPAGGGRGRWSEARKRQAEQTLVTELLSCPPEKRGELLAQPRFQEEGLFELLLELAQEKLPYDAGLAGELVTTAGEVGLVLEVSGDPETWLHNEGHARALCMMGTARRLLGDAARAEEALQNAGHLAVSPAARGYFCRCLALLRWDQGRIEEAAALLRQASLRCEQGGSAREEMACRALLALLLAEEGEMLRAAPLLDEACSSLELDPWLAARCELARALGFALAGEKKKARAAREKAWTFYKQVRNEDALLSLHWHEGRVAAWLGEGEDAVHVLDSVRRQWLQAGRLAETTLASIDLGLVLWDLHRGAEVADLIGELQARFAETPGIGLALHALEGYVRDLVQGSFSREVWSGLAPAFRQAFRLQGVSLKPLPFA
jgi:tetratricopeptide (TPR) repeat protein